MSRCTSDETWCQLTILNLRRKSTDATPLFVPVVHFEDGTHTFKAGGCVPSGVVLFRC